MVLNDLKFYRVGIFYLTMIQTFIVLCRALMKRVNEGPGEFKIHALLSHLG